MDHPLLALAGVVAIGIAAQWLSWRVHLPSILFLLLAGFVAGPVTGWLNPDALLGDVLFPLVSLAVAIILFEGGLSLDVAELRTIGKVVRRLASIGVVVTWFLATALAVLFLDFDLPLAALLGAILVVTGPTVIGPMLRQIRPSATVASAIKWEGIVNDPTGAILAVLVFDTILVGGLEPSVRTAATGAVRALVAGVLLGGLGAGLIVVMIRHFWVPDFLHSAVTLAVVLTVFTLSDLVWSESGLLAVTVMGSALASQRRVTVRHIVEFKENLRVLLIAVLFILLAARLPLDDPVYRQAGSILFLVSLVVIVRPVTVALSTWRTSLNWRERVFLALMAPRGIVAAAVASVFSLELVEVGYPRAAELAPIVFLVIVGTVALYGLTAGPAARWLGVASPNPQGLLILGAAPLIRNLGHALVQEGVRVVLLDSNWKNVSAARQSGLKASYGNALSEDILDQLELDGIGYFLAMTPNGEVNAIASLHIGEMFNRSHLYQIARDKGERVSEIPKHLEARVLFDDGATYGELQKRLTAGATFRRTNLTAEFGYDDFTARHGADAIPMFAVSPSGTVSVLEARGTRKPKPGQKLISLVREFPAGD